MSIAPKQLGLRPFDFWVGGSERKNCSNAQSCYSIISVEERSRTWIDNLEDGQPAFFKMYHFRGPISWLRERLFKFRVQREFDSLLYLSKCAIPCSEPLYWSYGHCPGFGRCELLVTRYIPQTQTLHDCIAQLESGDRHTGLCDLYRTVRSMHQHGLYHGALFPTNVIVSQDSADKLNPHIIDLPAAMVFPHDISFTRMANFDLLNLSTNLRDKFGIEYCAPYFSAYGLLGKALARMIDRLAHYRPTKHTRNRLRAEFTAKQFASKYF